jgi:hypothetical protein
MSAHAALRIPPRSSDEAAVRALYQQCMQKRHREEVLWMDPKAVELGPEAYLASQK